MMLLIIDSSEAAHLTSELRVTEVLQLRVYLLNVSIEVGLEKLLHQLDLLSKSLVLLFQNHGLLISGGVQSFQRLLHVEDLEVNLILPHQRLIAVLDDCSQLLVSLQQFVDLTASVRLQTIDFGSEGVYLLEAVWSIT